MQQKGNMRAGEAGAAELDAAGALREAERCLYCFDAPCTLACPVHIDVPGFIAMLRSGNRRGAAWLVRDANPLADTCGRICPSEIYCQSACTKAKQDAPVLIRELHLYATLSEKARDGRAEIPRQSGKRAAVLGGGPAGLGCAFELARLGHEVDLYNDGPPGGVPLKSIPPFRLPGEDLARDTEFLRSHFSLHETVIDRRVFDSVAASHDALFIAVGLGHDRPLGIPGENLRNVYPVLGFLETAKRNPRSLTIGSRVIVVGGGNVSLDAASTAVKLGADEVTLLYRRSEEQMLVWRAELAAARRLGVVFRFLSAPVSIAGKDRVEGVLCRGMRLGERVDGSGRPVPVPIPGSDTLFPADSVIVAIGQDLSAGWLPPLARTARGHISVDGSFRTSVAGMFAGGDAATGEGTVVRSLADGVQAARSMHQYMTGGG